MLYDSTTEYDSSTTFSGVGDGSSVLPYDSITLTEEQKRLRREAQGIIQRIKQADPVQADELLDDSKEISRQLQGAIAALEALAAEYQAQLEAQQALRAQEEAAALRNLLIEAQLQAELLQQQVEELDVAYIMFMLAAHA